MLNGNDAHKSDSVGKGKERKEATDVLRKQCVLIVKVSQATCKYLLQVSQEPRSAKITAKY